MMISEQQVRCLLVLKQAKVSGRCVRSCSKLFIKHGLVEHPGYRLRLRTDAETLVRQLVGES